MKRKLVKKTKTIATPGDSATRTQHTPRDVPARDDAGRRGAMTNATTNRRSLARYKMIRAAPRDQLPQGVRQDTRKHTRHVLAPTAELVTTYLTDPSDDAWSKYAMQYRALLRERFATERDRFDALADLARREHVHLGCSCPTRRNPDVRRCHTWLAIEFMGEVYPELDIRFPELALESA